MEKDYYTYVRNIIKDYKKLDNSDGSLIYFMIEHTWSTFTKKVFNKQINESKTPDHNVVIFIYSHEKIDILYSTKIDKIRSGVRKLKIDSLLNKTQTS